MAHPGNFFGKTNKNKTFQGLTRHVCQIVCLIKVDILNPL